MDTFLAICLVLAGVAFVLMVISISKQDKASPSNPPIGEWQDSVPPMNEWADSCPPIDLNAH